MLVVEPQPNQPFQPGMRNDFGRPALSGPEEPGIMIVKLRFGQEVNIKCIAHKVSYRFISRHDDGNVDADVFRAAIC